MFPQTYGTQYYGKRYPIKTEQQLSGSVKGSVFVNYTRVFLIHLTAVAKGIATFKPLDVIKKLFATVGGTVTLKKKISFALIVTCENIGKTTKHIISLPITAISKTAAAIKKQAQITLSTISRSLTCFCSKSIYKNMQAKTIGIVDTAKHIVFTPVFTACNVGARVAKHVTPIPTIAASNGIAIAKRYIQKILSTVVAGLASVTKHRLLEFEFIGSFAPGDVVRIDSKTMEVTLNDENVLHLIKKADFPIIQKGEQALIYSDKEGNRMVKVTVKWRDKWL